MRVLFVALLALAGCQRAESVPIAPSVEVVELDCDPARHFGLIKLTVHNVSGRDLGFTKAFIRVDGRLMEGVSSAGAAGALISYDFATGQARAVGSCELVAVQDQQGRSLL